MTRTVYITITGVQCDETGEEIITELSATGEYFEKNGSLYLLYEEADPESGTVTKNTLKARGQNITLTKRGCVQSQMQFAPEEIHPAEYITPYGILHIQIYTEDVKILFGDIRGEIRLRYALYSDGELLSRCRLTVICRAAESLYPENT